MVLKMAALWVVWKAVRRAVLKVALKVLLKVEHSDALTVKKTE